MNSSPKRTLALVRWGLSLAILALAVLTAVGLYVTRPRAKSEPPAEPALAVSLRIAAYTNVVVRVESFGVARALRTVEIAPETGGRIVEVPRLLRAGDRVAEGEVLFRIDGADANSALREAEASRDRLRAALAELDIQERADRERQGVLTRIRDLARNEFDRVSRLFEEQQIGSASAVEGAEQAFRAAQNNLLLLEQSLALVSERRNGLESEFRASEARVERAQRIVERCEVRAPFAGRITTFHAERGLLAQPGVPLAGIADDSALEIAVAVTASELRQWIPFAEEPAPGRAWFPPLPELPVRVEWTEGAVTHAWEGLLHRVISYDATTRSAMIAVRVAGDALRPQEGFPLTDGMFCRVLLPGNRLERVVALPVGAVTFDGKAYLSVDGRLRTVSVRVRRTEGETAFVEGIPEGALVVTTRIIAPLEGVRLIAAE